MTKIYLKKEEKTKKPWSAEFKRCIDCKRSNRRYGSKGRCQACYSRYRWKTDAKFRKKHSKCVINWMKKHPDQWREIQRRAQNKFNKKIKTLKKKAKKRSI